MQKNHYLHNLCGSKGRDMATESICILEGRILEVHQKFQTGGLSGSVIVLLWSRTAQLARKCLVFTSSLIEFFADDVVPMSVVTFHCLCARTRACVCVHMCGLESGCMHAYMCVFCVCVRAYVLLPWHSGKSVLCLARRVFEKARSSIRRISTNHQASYSTVR